MKSKNFKEGKIYLNLEHFNKDQNCKRKIHLRLSSSVTNHLATIQLLLSI